MHESFGERARRRPAGVSSCQSTLRYPVRCSGVGLHTGRGVTMTLGPAEADTGIRVQRTDVAPCRGLIPVDLDHVTESRLSTSVANAHGVGVSTVEHLMAALAGCGIDNAAIEIDGPEVPIMDGSALPFVDLIRRAETVTLPAPRRAIKVLRPVVVGDGTSMVSLVPADRLSVRFMIEFDSPAVARQELSVAIDEDSFDHDIAAARTFGFAEEVVRLRQAGLALGGSLDNAVVVDGGRVLNEGGLRFDDEFVRHKILDCIGDLYLAGAPIIGRVVALRSGHAANHDLLRALFADDGAWAWSSPSGAPLAFSARGAAASAVA